MTTQPAFLLQPSLTRAFFGMALAMVTLMQSTPVAAQLPPPNLTHVNNVNAAGNATLHWDVFSPVGDEEFLQNEIKVFDLQTNPLGNQWHIITSEIVNGNLILPTGWVMPSFLYDANQLAHCYVGVQKTEEDGVVSVSDMSDFLCSIHVDISEGAAPGTVDLVWNSPYALSGEAAGGPFILERLNESTAEWDWVADMPDGVFGASYTDNPGPCVQALVYRVRQMASNGEDEHVSNVANLVVGTVGGETPVVSHVDVANGLAHVHWDFEPAEETLGYMIYKCLGNGSGAIVGTIDDPDASDFVVPTSLAATEQESYQVAAYDCVDDDGMPNPSGAGDCVRTVFLEANQVPCTDRALLAWGYPVGIAGDVDQFIPQVREGGGNWVSLDTLSGTVQTTVHEGAALDVTVEYRVLAVGGESQTATSNLVEVSFEYPDAPEAPVMKRVSVLDKASVELVLATDPLAQEVAIYEFQRWNEVDSTWIPLTPKYPSSLGFPVNHTDQGLNTDEFQYRYRAVAYNGCEAVVGESQEAETILLRAFRSTTPGMYENSLVWTPYDGFNNGLDRYEVLRKETTDAGVLGQPLATVLAIQETHEDEVGDEFDSPGTFCYQVLALEVPDSNETLQGSASNWVCLTEDPIVWIPNAFTPNQDQTNDWFPWPPGQAQVGFLGEPQGDNPNFKMDIVSRWGTSVFSSQSIDDPWNGRVDGRMVEQGLYIAHIQYLDGAGSWRSQTVPLTVLPGK